jgi:hypothetical protein
MKPENKELIKALLQEADSIQEDIYDDAKKMLGTVPFILRVMARRPEFLVFSAPKAPYALRLQDLLHTFPEIETAPIDSDACAGDEIPAPYPNWQV